MTQNQRTDGTPTEPSADPDGPPGDAPARGADDGATADGASSDRNKKERVLHTRVPAVLEAELKRFADSLRIPVSNLVRTMLEDALAVADRASGRVEEELRSVAARVNDERERLRRVMPRADPMEAVYGFQPLVMNVHSACAKCRVALAPGADANLGLSDRPGPRVFVCPSCLPGRKSPSANKGDRNE